MAHTSLRERLIAPAFGARTGTAEPAAVGSFVVAASTVGPTARPQRPGWYVVAAGRQRFWDGSGWSVAITAAVHEVASADVARASSVEAGSAEVGSVDAHLVAV